MYGGSGSPFSQQQGGDKASERRKFYATYTGPKEGELTLPAPGLPVPEELPARWAAYLKDKRPICYSTRLVQKFNCNGKKGDQRVLIITREYLLMCETKQLTVKRAIHLQDVESVKYMQCGSHDPKNLHFVINTTHGKGEISMEFETLVDEPTNLGRGVWHSILALNDARSNYIETALPIERFTDPVRLRQAGNFDKTQQIPISKRTETLRSSPRRSAYTTPLGQATLKRAANTSSIQPVMQVPEGLAGGRQPPVTLEVRSAPGEQLGMSIKAMVLESVDASGPAGRAGGADCIGLSLTHCDGNPITDLGGLRKQLEGKQAFSLTFGLRNELRVVRSSPEESLGIKYEVSDTLGAVIVTGVTPGDACDRAGVAAFIGTCLTHIDGIPCPPNTPGLQALVSGKTDMVLRFREANGQPAPEDMSTLMSPRLAQNAQHAPLPAVFADDGSGTPVATAAPPLEQPQQALHLPSSAPSAPAPSSGNPAGQPQPGGMRDFLVTRDHVGDRLGLQYHTIPYNGKQVLAMMGVVPGSASDKSGVGQLFGQGQHYSIAAVDGSPIGSDSELERACEGKVALLFRFDTLPEDFLNMPLPMPPPVAAEAPRPNPMPSAASELPLGPDTIRRGPGERIGLLLSSFRVTGVEPGSPAERCGFHRHIGKRVAAINGAAVRTIPEMENASDGLTDIHYTFSDDPTPAPPAAAEGGPTSSALQQHPSIVSIPSAPLGKPSSVPQAATSPTLPNTSMDAVPRAASGGGAPPPSDPPSDIGDARLVGEMGVAPGVHVDEGYVLPSPGDGGDDDIEEVNPQGSGGAYATVMHAVAQLVDRQSRTEDLLCTLLSSLQSSQTGPAIEDRPRRRSHRRRGAEPVGPPRVPRGGSWSRSGSPPNGVSPPTSPDRGSSQSPGLSEGMRAGSAPYFGGAPRDSDLPVFSHQGGGGGGGAAPWGGGRGYPQQRYPGGGVGGGSATGASPPRSPGFTPNAPYPYTPMGGYGGSPVGGGGGGGVAFPNGGGVPSSLAHYPRGAPFPGAGRQGGGVELPLVPAGGGGAGRGRSVPYNKVEIDLAAGKVVLM